MNSVKILHAVRSAITAIAELLVLKTFKAMTGLLLCLRAVKKLLTHSLTRIERLFVSGGFVWRTTPTRAKMIGSLLATTGSETGRTVRTFTRLRLSVLDCTGMPAVADPGLVNGRSQGRVL